MVLKVVQNFNLFFRIDIYVFIFDVGITQNKTSLDRYFTIAPTLTAIVNEFHGMFIDQKEHATVHHELIGGKSSRMSANVRIMSDVLRKAGLGAEAADTPLHNIFTKEVIPPNIARDVIDREILGAKLRDECITERLTKGLKSIWEPMSKSNILTFSSNFVVVDPRTAKVKRLKEDRNLFQRFIIASRSRKDLDVKSLISRYEFGNVCRSLFACDGNLLLAADKSKMVAYLENKVKDLPISEREGSHKVLIIDGVALLHKIKKTAEIST